MDSQGQPASGRRVVSVIWDSRMKGCNPREKDGIQRGPTRMEGKNPYKNSKDALSALQFMVAVFWRMAGTSQLQKLHPSVLHLNTDDWWRAGRGGRGGEMIYWHRKMS